MEVDLLNVSPAEHRASVRKKKEFASSLAMQRCNERYSKRKLQWMVAENFTERKNQTWLVHMTYSDEWLPYYDEDAENNVTNWLDKMNRRQAKKYAAAIREILQTPAGCCRE